MHSILLTNDDGFGAPGLNALETASLGLGRVSVVAPLHEQSGSSHALSIRRPLRMEEVATDRYRVDGTPTDCVHLAVALLEQKPDLVLSGVNRGENIGDDVTYSGTVAGALEAVLLGIPAIAISAGTPVDGRYRYDLAARVASRLAARVLEVGLPEGVFLNVNVPGVDPTGVRVTRQGRRHYRAKVVERHDPAGRPYYWIAESDNTPKGEPDGDHAALERGEISITPLHANLTHVETLPSLEGWAVDALKVEVT